MSEPIQDGGPAFPTKHEALDPRATGWTMEPGMTLRDYFAGQALNGLLASGINGGVAGPDWAEADYTYTSYQFADAMIAAREARP